MKKLITVLYFILAALSYANPVFSQIGKCEINAEQLLKLIGANGDMAENILLPCYQIVSGDTSRIYRIDYNCNKALCDYNIINITTHNVQFSTTSVETYTAIKSKLVRFGFKYIKDETVFDQKKSFYRFKKYDMRVYSRKNKNENTEYVISIFDY